MARVIREVAPGEIVVLHVDIAVTNKTPAHEEVMRLIARVRLRVVPPDSEQGHQDNQNGNDARRHSETTTPIARGADPAAHRLHATASVAARKN
jgi:hypothetical protein